MPALRPKIGLSPRILHHVPAELGFKGKTLQYMEQSLAHWAMSRGAMILMLPTIETESVIRRSDVAIGDYVQELDGLILQGGADVCPLSYGEEPLQPEWSGDPVRDRFEIELLFAFIRSGKPVLGVCRGMQLLNVAFGGSLYQDLPTQRPGAVSHHDQENYDNHFHRIRILPDTGLAELYHGLPGATVNSIHHQAVKDLGREMQVEAVSDDGLVEAIRWDGESYVFGVQWHPEFHDPRNKDLLDGTPMLDEFLAHARAFVRQPELV